MPYTHYTTDERNALQAMEGMGLPKSFMSVILGKHHSSIYREFNRNGSGGERTKTVGEQAESKNRRRRAYERDYRAVQKRSVAGSDFRPVKGTIP
jgi:IS30 family transposase